MERGSTDAAGVVAVLPARRAEATIRAALESLRLGNGACVGRVLVVTSEDDPTAGVVRAWSKHDPCVEVVLLAEPASAGRARNEGVARAGGGAGLVLFLDADCRLEAGGARRLAVELDRRGAAALSARVLGSRGAVARCRHLLEFKEAASHRAPPPGWLPPSTAMLCRREAFERAGGFPDLWPGEDLVFSQALRDLGERVERSTHVTVLHQHPDGVPGMLRHQLRLGRTAAIARRLRAMPGSAIARRAWLVPLLLPARLLRLAAWQAREGSSALLQAAALSPLLVAGLAAWTAGFVAGAASRRPPTSSGYPGKDFAGGSAAAERRRTTGPSRAPAQGAVAG